MTLVVNGWDGLWSSLLGGLVSAVTVVIGVVLAQRLNDVRKRNDEMRKAADALILAVANTRDAAAHSDSRARSGQYGLWPLRHEMYLSHALRTSPILEAVQNYYNAVRELRDWVRHVPVVEGDRPPGDPSDEHLFTTYQQAIHDWAEELIRALSDLSTSVSDLAKDGPERPALPR